MKNAKQYTGAGGPGIDQQSKVIVIILRCIDSGNVDAQLIHLSESRSLWSLQITITLTEGS